MRKLVEKGKKMITLSILAMVVMCGTALAANIDAIVPASLPITVSADGSVVTATNASIQNYGSDPLLVSSINVAAQNGWSLATKDTAAAAAIGDKVIAMGFNNSWMSADGTIDTSNFSRIDSNKSLDITYDAKIPGAIASEDKTTAALTTFVVKELPIPTMASSYSWYKSTVNRNTITKITFMDSYTPSTKADENWFADVNNTGSITCYRTGTEIIIAGNGSGEIQGNADASYMFSYDDYFSRFAKLTSIENLPLLDTSQVTSMKVMFEGCNSLTSIDFSHFNTSNVTTMGFMFTSCNSLTSIDLSHFDTSNVTNMGNMFSSCRGLTDLDLSHFDTSNVTDMSSMFQDCRKLTTIDLSYFYPSNATNMSSMFYRCSGLTSLDLSNFDTSNVTDMGYMFSESDSLTSLDLSNFDTSNVTNMTSMFSKCNNLVTIYASDKWNTNKVTSSTKMFYNCTRLKGDIAFNSNYVDKTYATIHNGYLTAKNVAVPMLAYEFSWFTNGFESSYDADSYMTSIKKIIFKDSYTPSGNESKSWNADSKNSGAIKCYLSDNTLIVAGNGSGSIKANPDSSFMFYEIEQEVGFYDSLTEIDGLELLDTSGVTSMHDMFYDCWGLTTLDLSNFDTSSVTNMNYMFFSCKNLTTIYVSDKWNTDKVTSSYDMFANCGKLKGDIAVADRNSCDKTYAKTSGGYLTYKAATQKTLSLNIDPNSGAVTSYDVSTSPMSTYKGMIRTVAAA